MLRWGRGREEIRGPNDARETGRAKGTHVLLSLNAVQHRAAATVIPAPAALAEASEDPRGQEEGQGGDGRDELHGCAMDLHCVAEAGEVRRSK